MFLLGELPKTNSSRIVLFLQLTYLDAMLIMIATNFMELQNQQVATTMHITLSISSEKLKEGVIMPKLVHGDSLVWVETGSEDINACDAVGTTNKGFSLGVSTADCAPICFGDGNKIAIAHVGWRGLCLGLTEKVLNEFDQSTVEIFVGPRLDTFEIQKDFCYDALVQKFGEQYFTFEEENILFHFKDVIASCLPPQARFDERSTGTDLSLPSHRRGGMRERLITVVQFKS